MTDIQRMLWRGLLIRIKDFRQISGYDAAKFIAWLFFSIVGIGISQSAIITELDPAFIPWARWAIAVSVSILAALLSNSVIDYIEYSDGCDECD